MFKQLTTVKACDWSINLEDSYFAEHPEELLQEALAAVNETGAGYYVNLVTPAELGDPRDEWLPLLTERLQQAGIAYETIRYVDECGCGGHVSRVYR